MRIFRTVYCVDENFSRNGSYVRYMETVGGNKLDAEEAGGKCPSPKLDEKRYPKL